MYYNLGIGDKMNKRDLVVYVIKNTVMTTQITNILNVIADCIKNKIPLKIKVKDEWIVIV